MWFHVSALLCLLGVAAINWDDKIIEIACSRLQAYYQLTWAERVLAFLDGKISKVENPHRRVPLVSTLPFRSDSRYVVFGDLHGDFDKACALLIQAKVIDLDGKWIGGSDTYVISLGDLVDKGVHATLIYQMLFDLQDQSCNIACPEDVRSKALNPPESCDSTNVFLIYGNHEQFHLRNDRHMTVEKYWIEVPTASYISSLVRLYNQLTDTLESSLKSALPNNSHGKLLVSDWLSVDFMKQQLAVLKHISVTEGLMDAASTNRKNNEDSLLTVTWHIKRGILGNEMWRRYQTLLKLGDIALFAHGGVNLSFLDFVAPKNEDGDAIVRRVNEKIQQFFWNAESKDYGREERVYLTGDSPLWTRTVAANPLNPRVCEEHRKVLKRLNIQGIAVGHTPRDTIDLGSCQNTQIVLDIDMCYRGRNRPVLYLEIATNSRRKVEWAVYSRDPNRSRRHLFRSDPWQGLDPRIELR